MCSPVSTLVTHSIISSYEIVCPFYHEVKKLFLAVLALFLKAKGNCWQELFVSVEANFVEYQKKILALFEHSEQLDLHAEYYKLGKEYNIEANIDNYSVSNFVKNNYILFNINIFLFLSFSSMWINTC